MTFIEKLYIPAGIRFECTGCGNCCLQWPVPATEADFQKISSSLQGIQTDIASSGLKEDWQIELANAKPNTLFKKLRHETSEDRMQLFTHTLQKRADGRCVFLTEDNRCCLHARASEESKPSMCQLFPYTFTQTPDGHYASVSFASTGVLLNSGALLTEQSDFLLGKLLLFKRLYPTLDTDWTKLQLVEGQPIDWAEYLRLEEYLLDAFRFDDANQSTFFQLNIFDSLALLSSTLVRHASAKTDLDLDHLVPALPERVDLILLKSLMEYFFPREHSVADATTIDGKDLLSGIASSVRDVCINLDGQEVPLAEICRIKLPPMDSQIVQLFNRFIYCRVFAKLYVGPGLGHFSMVSGLHFLGILIALINLQMKCILARTAQTATLDFLDAAELLRTLERQLTILRFSQESSAVLQVLMQSPNRFARILQLAS